MSWVLEPESASRRRRIGGKSLRVEGGMVMVRALALAVAMAAIVAGDGSKVQCFRTGKPDTRGSIE